MSPPSDEPLRQPEYPPPRTPRSAVSSRSRPNVTGSRPPSPSPDHPGQSTLRHVDRNPLDDYPRSATRLLLAMSRSTAGWSAHHLDTLLIGFGFQKRDSGGHTFYRHPATTSLRWQCRGPAIATLPGGRRGAPRRARCSHHDPRSRSEPRPQLLPGTPVPTGVGVAPRTTPSRTGSCASERSPRSWETG